MTIVHRRDEFRASRIMLERAAADPKIAGWNNAEVEQVLGENAACPALRLRDTVTGEESRPRGHRMFVAIGHDPRSELVERPARHRRRGLHADPRRQRTCTNLPGVFAAGDVVDHTYRQAITAAGTGCAAALDAERYLATETASDTRGTGRGSGHDQLEPSPAAALHRKPPRP